MYHFEVYSHEAYAVVCHSMQFKETETQLEFQSPACSLIPPLSLSLSLSLSLDHVCNHLASLAQFHRTVVIFFLPINVNICYERSKEPSHRDGSFEYPQ